jgi:hypothetical protein
VLFPFAGAEGKEDESTATLNDLISSRTFRATEVCAGGTCQTCGLAGAACCTGNLCDADDFLNPRRVDLPSPGRRQS